MGSSATRVFAGTIGDLRGMSTWFRSLAVAAGLDSDTAWQAELCLNEAGSNIILHGYDDGVPHPIEVEVAALGPAVRITIIDTGRPFNPAEPRELPVARTIDELSVGGLGVHLIQSFASRIEYRRDQDRNVLALTFAAAADPEAAGRPRRSGPN
jgi:serine/threonine-protein kinase RsbW